ncbi:hypothetical protein EOM33_01705 [Candidatus Saccharibacteria bacterium]|nr:hypothetical protein [Candidatus Saccharibacteria bacterium]
MFRPTEEIYPANITIGDVLDNDATDFIDFGPKSVSPVTYALINELPQQVRKTYEPAQIDDLAIAMTIPPPSDGAEVEFDMFNPLLCAHLSHEDTVQYLKEYSEFYGVETDVSELRPDENGRYTILISGHRRKRAIRQLISENDLDISKVRAHVNQRDSITFEKALVAQVRENTYEKVPPEEVARHIEQFYKYLCSTQPEKPTHREIARKLGQSENIVSTALRFCSLPEEIQSLANRKVLAFSTVARLAPVYERRKKYYKWMEAGGKVLNESIDDYSLNNLRVLVNSILRAKIESDEKIDRLIRQELAALDQQMAYQQSEFVLLSPDHSVANQIKRSATLLARTALSGLSYALEQNPSALTPEQVLELERLVKEAKDAALPSQPSQDTPLF